MEKILFKVSFIDQIKCSGIKLIFSDYLQLWQFYRIFLNCLFVKISSIYVNDDSIYLI